MGNRNISGDGATAVVTAVCRRADATAIEQQANAAYIAAGITAAVDIGNRTAGQCDSRSIGNRATSIIAAVNCTGNIAVDGHIGAVYSTV